MFMCIAMEVNEWAKYRLQVELKSTLFYFATNSLEAYLVERKGFERSDLLRNVK
jgi:hypothetical protein